MPKRLVDGDAIATSRKIRLVREEYRIHYPYLLTLALGNGSFECDPETIWQQMYATFMPSVTVSQIRDMLDEFQRVKMLFRWESEGKVWGHWVGQTKSGRLPAPSEKGRHKLGAEIPPRKLAKFISPTSRVNREAVDTVSRLGIGIGTGTGKGVGNGVGVGVGNGEGSGEGQGAAKQPIDSNDADAATLTFSSPTTTPTSNDNDQREAQAQVPDENGLVEPKARVSTSQLEKQKREQLHFWVTLLKLLLNDNPNVTSIPDNYVDLWTSDFKSLLGKVDPKVISNVIFLSQLPKNQKYFVRSKPIVEKIDSLLEQVQEEHHRRAIKVLAEKFKAKHGLEKLTDLFDRYPMSKSSEVEL